MIEEEEGDEDDGKLCYLKNIMIHFWPESFLLDVKWL